MPPLCRTHIYIQTFSTVHRSQRFMATTRVVSFSDSGRYHPEVIDPISPACELYQTLRHPSLDDGENLTCHIFRQDWVAIRPCQAMLPGVFSLNAFVNRVCRRSVIRVVRAPLSGNLRHFGHLIRMTMLALLPGPRASRVESRAMECPASVGVRSKLVEKALF